MSFRPEAYGPAFAPLLDIDRSRSLGPGRPARDMETTLEALTLEQAFAHAEVVDDSMAAGCVSGVWLLHDFLDRSHEISQSIPTRDGSYWHGIMHRREGDFSNAKYWFRRVGEHPVFGDLLTAAREYAVEQTGRVSDRLGRLDCWDPYLMVDLCESAVRQKGSDANLLREIQRAEWEHLFDYCYRHATAAPT